MSAMSDALALLALPFAAAVVVTLVAAGLLWWLVPAREDARISV